MGKEQPTVLLHSSSNGVKPSNTRFFESNLDYVARGFDTLGYRTIPFDLATLGQEKHLSIRNPVKGTVKAVHKAFALLGLPLYPNIDIPESIREFAHRELWTSTIGELVDNFEKYAGKVFIKPLEVQKAFRGTAVGWTHGWQKVKMYPRDFKVLCQENVFFYANEYRVHVFHGKILENNEYSFPNQNAKRKVLSFAKKVIKAYKDAPVAYVLDVDEMRKNDNEKSVMAVVETNEVLTAQLYCDPKMAALMVQARWRELTEK